MPELPEVELVAKSLQKLVSTRKITAAELHRERLVPDISPSDFANTLKDATINFVHRRGKHILMDLDNRKTLLVHLRMTGRFMLLPAERALPKHAHAVFYFSDEDRLIFQDQRHFGLMKLLDTKLLFEARELEKLAPEPLSDAFSLKYFKKVLRDSKRNLKEFLLDQTKVCGLGNIYASEAMFMAKINPRILTNKISGKKAGILFEQIRQVLTESIEHGSTLRVDPENIDGSYYGGEYEGHWRVYDQADLPCQICGAQIERIVQGGRSTYFCPDCQR